MLRRGSKLLMNILRTFNISEEVIRRCSIIKGVLRNFAKFTGKHLYRRLFFNKVAGLRAASLLKKRLWHRCFSVSFAKFLRAPFTINTSGWLFLICVLCLRDICPWILVCWRENLVSEAYSEPCQTSKMELFAKIVKRNRFIVSAWQYSEHASGFPYLICIVEDTFVNFC